VNTLRTEITVSAFEQFRQYGFKSVTMDDIARNIGVSKKTLYEQFKDKDELVLETVKYMLAKNQEETESAFKSAKNAVEQIIALLFIMERMVRGMNLVCYVDLTRHYPAANKYLQEHKESFLFQCISENLRQGIHEGLYRADIDVEIISRFRMESALIVFQNNIFPQEKYDTVTVNNQIFANYMYGIASLSGHKLITKYLSGQQKK
jgi:AcrR family transcriptional regulator